MPPGADAELDSLFDDFHANPLGNWLPVHYGPCTDAARRQKTFPFPFPSEPGGDSVTEPADTIKGRPIRVNCPLVQYRTSLWGEPNQQK
jgi:hypothetical protein